MELFEERSRVKSFMSLVEMLDLLGRVVYVQRNSLSDGPWSGPIASRELSYISTGQRKPELFSF